MSGCLAGNPESVQAILRNLTLAVCESWRSQRCACRPHMAPAGVWLRSARKTRECRYLAPKLRRYRQAVWEQAPREASACHREQLVDSRSYSRLYSSPLSRANTRKTLRTGVWFALTSGQLRDEPLPIRGVLSFMGTRIGSHRWG